MSKLLPFTPACDTVFFVFSTKDMIMPIKKKRRAWTKTDLTDLKALAKKKTPAPKIAKSLKRTVGATRQKAFSLGVSLNSRA